MADPNAPKRCIAVPLTKEECMCLAKALARYEPVGLTRQEHERLFTRMFETGVKCAFFDVERKA